MDILPANFLIACTAYFIGVSSPGPSTMAVMGMAMAHGRARALALGGGMLCGSMFWGLCAAFGMAALMQRYAAALVALKIVGGMYLLWLAWQAGRKAVDGRPAAAAGAGEAAPGYRQTWLRGLGLHLTSPKPIIVWMSVTSLALPAGADKWAALSFVGTCLPIGAAVFACYALAFSTQAARRAYQAGARGIQAVLAGVFAYAGVRLLLSSPR